MQTPNQGPNGANSERGLKGPTVVALAFDAVRSPAEASVCTETRPGGKRPASVKLAPFSVKNPKAGLGREGASSHVTRGLGIGLTTKKGGASQGRLGIDMVSHVIQATAGGAPERASRIRLLTRRLVDITNTST